MQNPGSTLLFLTVLSFVAPICAQTQEKSTTTPSQNVNSISAPPMSMPFVVPLFLEEPNFSSTLGVINEASVVVTAQMEIYSLDGRKVMEKSIALEPNGARQIAIGPMLAEAGVNLTVGSVRLTPDHNGGMLAALAITHHGLHETYFEEEIVMPSKDGSTTVHGVAEGVADSPLIAISSLASDAQHVTVACLREHGQSQTHTFLIEGNQTLLTEPCVNGSAGPLFSMPDTTAVTTGNDDSEGRNGAVGVSITTDGMPGQIAAYGIAPHTRQQERFYTSVNFVDPKMRHSSGVAYTGIPVGPSPLLPEGDYKPVVALTNFGVKPISIAITSATTLDGSPKTEILSKLTLAGGASKTVKLTGVSPSTELLNSILIESDSAPGDLSTKLMSHGTSHLLHAVEMIERDESNAENGGGHPWNIDGVSSVLLLFNHDVGPQTFSVRFGTPMGPWIKTYKLASMETRAISINQLIQGQVTDDHGRSLPVGITSGEVGWAAGSTRVGGRLLQASAALGMARNFSCTGYLYECSLSLAPNSSLNLASGAQGDLGDITPTVNTSYPNPPSSCVCNGSPSSQTLPLVYLWSNNDPSIVNLVGADNQSSATFQAVGVGSTFVDYSATQTAYNLTCNGSAPATVNPPSVSISGGAGVPINGTGQYTVTVSPSGNTAPIVLSLSVTSGSGSATFSNGSTSMTITGSTTVTVQGKTASSTVNNITLAAAMQAPPGKQVGSAKLSVVSVTISLRASGSPSTDNSADASYQSVTGHNTLGQILLNTSPNSCAIGTELVGTVTPSNYTGTIVLRRNIVSDGQFSGTTGQTGVTAPATGKDDSAPMYEDTNPQSGGSNGKVYDLDTPGIGTSSSTNIVRIRLNFNEYAVLDSASSTQSVGSLGYYVRASCRENPSPTQYLVMFSNDVAGDNTAGVGTTPLTWNLH